MTAAVVLAGGRSTRFGRDKLAVGVAGGTLLSRTVEAAVAAGCRPVVVVTAKPLPGDHVAVSEWPRWAGPCAAIAAGVDALGTADAREALDALGGSGGEAVIVPADLAHPEAAIDALLSEPGPAVLRDADGHAQWLLARAPVALLRERIAELRRTARSSLADLPARALLGALPPSGRPLPGHVIADIDRPADLDLMKELTHGTV